MGMVFVLGELSLNRKANVLPKNGAQFLWMDCASTLRIDFSYSPVLSLYATNRLSISQNSTVDSFVNIVIF